MTRERFLNGKGTAITFVMIIMIIVSISATTAILFVSNQCRVATRTKQQAQAHYLALAGLRYGAWYEEQGNTLSTDENNPDTMPDIDGDESNIEVKVWKTTTPPVEIHSKAIF